MEYLNDNDDDDPIGKVEEVETASILELDCQPDLDIYGDFEYDLEGDDYILELPQSMFHMHK